MKALLALALLAVTTHAQAAIRVVGKFEAQKQISMMGYDEAECREAEGTWGGEDGGCVLNSSDEVELTVERGKGRVKVDTIGSNGHLCGYDGSAVRINEKVVIASAPSEIFVPGQNGQPDKFVKGVCKLRLTYADSNHLKVEQISTYEACRFFCGMNAVLDVDGAVRK